MKYPFDREVDNRRIQMSVIETAMINVVRAGSIQVAKWALRRKMDKDLIVQETKLTLEELDQIERGEDPDRNTDDDED